MPCPEAVFIGSNLVFSVTIHDPDTGGLYDVTPSYKIYDVEDSSLVDSGTMTKLDSGETGFYSAKHLCESTDFYDGGDYILIIKAVVNGETGGIVYQFSAHEEITAPIGLPIIIQGFDAQTGRQVHITGRYK